MKAVIRKFFRILIFLIVFLLLLAGGVLIFYELTDYSPADEEIFFSEKSSNDKIDTVSVVSWNIGYCGLGEDMDFFFDGGIRVRDKEANVGENINAIGRELKKLNADFFCLQEVDFCSKRSYFTDQKALLDSILEGFYSFKALNYKCPYVPVPLSDPFGKVESGIMTFSRIEPGVVVVRSLPVKFTWPNGYFMPDRCFLVERFRISDTCQFILINIHNSAFDDGSVRNRQVGEIMKFAVNEYSEGNHVLICGDWNQCPPGVSAGLQEEGAEFTVTSVDTSLIPSEWLIVSEGKSTNRFLDMPYQKGISRETVLDFFVVSPGIEIIEKKTIDLGFRNSDHQPVRVKLALPAR
ncbi:MAG: endonuclease/exonuclease/phosphatase family protein [Bacteroidota bacterium]